MTLPRYRALSVTVGRVMMGLRMYSFIHVMIDCLNYVRSVALSSARSTNQGN